MLGQTIYEQKNTTKSEHDFDLSAQPKGVYFLNIIP